MAQNGDALDYASEALGADLGIRLAAELNGYDNLSYEALLPQNMREIYSDSSTFSEFSDESSDVYRYFISEDPLCLLCNLDNVDAEGEGVMKCSLIS